MEKITSLDKLHQIYSSTGIERAAEIIEIRSPNDDNFWEVREQCRMKHTYTPVKIEGDDPLRFLHISTDDPAKVAYTKDADYGRKDIQTRTTLVKYCQEYGLDDPVVGRGVQVSSAGTESNIAYCARQLADALAQVAVLKEKMRVLLG